MENNIEVKIIFDKESGTQQGIRLQRALQREIKYQPFGVPPKRNRRTEMEDHSTLQEQTHEDGQAHEEGCAVRNSEDRINQMTEENNRTGEQNGEGNLNGNNNSIGNVNVGGVEWNRLRRR